MSREGVKRTCTEKLLIGVAPRFTLVPLQLHRKIGLQQDGMAPMSQDERVTLGCLVGLLRSFAILVFTSWHRMSAIAAPTAGLAHPPLPGGLQGHWALLLELPLAC